MTQRLFGKEHIVTSVVAVMIDERERVLLTKRSIPPFKNMWVMPGGKIDLGDSPRTVRLPDTRRDPVYPCKGVYRVHRISFRVVTMPQIIDKKVNLSFPLGHHLEFLERFSVDNAEATALLDYDIDSGDVLGMPVTLQ